MARKIALALVGVLVLASCGHRQDAAVTVDATIDAHALAASADQTAQAGTGTTHLTMTMHLTVPDSAARSKIPSSFDFTGDGQYDTTAGLSSMSIDMGSAFAGLLGSLPGGATNGIGVTEQVIQHGHLTYVRAPALAILSPALADKWIKIDADQRPGAAGSTPNNVLSGFNGVGDPSAILDYLKGAGADVTTVGHEPVGGVDTTHVHATLSMAQALAASGADHDKIEQSLQKLTGGSADALTSLSFPVDVYVGGDGYVRRIAIDYDFGGLLGALGSSKGTAGSGATMGMGMRATVTVDYADFGQPVTIDEPAADQTISMCDLLGSMPGQPTSRAAIPSPVC